MIHSKIIYSVPGIGSITFGAEKPYQLERFDGTSLGASKLTNTAVNLSGQRTSRVTLNARTIPCELAVSGVDFVGRFSYELLHQRMQEICKILNPLYKGTLTRVNRYGTYSIEVSPSAVPTFERFVGATSKFKVDFVADSPMWRDTKTKTYYIGGEYGTNLKIFNTLGVDLPFVFKGVAEVGDNLFKLTNETTAESIELADILRAKNWHFVLNTENCEVKTRISEDEEFKIGDFIFTFQSAVDMVLKPGCNSFMLEAQNAEAVFAIEVTDMFVGVS